MRELGTLQQLRCIDAACCLCGETMLGNYIRHKDETSSEKIYSECPEWSNSVMQKGYVFGKPGDLNKIYFEMPWMWARVYRASEYLLKKKTSIVNLLTRFYISLPRQQNQQ